MKRDERLVRLSREHHHALVLSLRIDRELPRGDDEALARLYSDLLTFWSAGLMPHFTAEGECLLARLVRHVDPEAEPVRRLERDHLAMQALVASMRDADGLEARREALASFGTRLREHVRWEENELFPLVEQAFEDAELDALGEDLAARLPEQPVACPTPPPPRA